jgi:hypothetical protein
MTKSYQDIEVESLEKGRELLLITSVMVTDKPWDGP